jgi:hypothetical protein
LLKSLAERISKRRWFIDEQLWTFLVATLIAEHPQKYLPLFVDPARSLPAGGCVACEAEPLSTRNREGNTVLDIAFGHIEPRLLPPKNGASSDKALVEGISYGPHAQGSWVCFVEAKCLSDVSTRVTHDALRNQLTRILENLLCFQANGSVPSHLYFALLTPKVFRDQPNTRLYGYKMRDYKNRAALIADIDACKLRRRRTAGYCYPDLSRRIDALAQIQWVTFEDVLQLGGIGDEALDIVSRPRDLGYIQEQIRQRIVLQQLVTVATRPDIAIAPA